jgi:hypothetical protein
MEEAAAFTEAVAFTEDGAAGTEVAGTEVVAVGGGGLPP